MRQEILDGIGYIMYEEYKEPIMFIFLGDKTFIWSMGRIHYQSKGFYTSSFSYNSRKL